MTTALGVQPISVRSQLVAKLREAILRGRFKPGQHLVERSLASEAGTSQVTVREALQALAQEGLVTKKANTGTYVTELTVERLREIIDVRLLLEPQAVWLASKRLNAARTEQLRLQASEIQRQARLHDIYHSSRADFQFHQLLWEIGGNATLAQYLRQLCTAYFAYTSILPGLSEQDLDKQFGSHDALRENWRAGLEDRYDRHVALLNVVVEGDRDTIERAVREHIQEPWKWLLS